jgi:hypothetical protein
MENREYKQLIEHIKDFQPQMPEKDAFVNQVMDETATSTKNQANISAVIFSWTKNPAVRYSLTGAAAAFLILFAIQNAVLFDRVRKVENQISVQQHNTTGVRNVKASQIETYLKKFGGMNSLSGFVDETDVETLLQQNMELKKFLDNHPEIKKMVEEETSVYDGIPKVSL